MSARDDQDDVEATLGDLIVASIEKSGGLDIDRLAERILAAGWQPPACVITTAEELDALPDGSVVVDDEMAALQKDNGRWEELSGIGYSSEDILDIGPVTVLHEGARDE